MAYPLVAANWKMNTTISEALDLVSRMKDRLCGIEGVTTVLCPSFTALAAVNEAVAGTPLRVGAQNMYCEECGAYTGEVSPPMVAELCRYVILGHSERRTYFGETDELINGKLLAALGVGLRPILCVGERLEERDQGRAKATVTGQLDGALRGVGQADTLVVAYEPVWAIGGGHPATGEVAEAMMGLIRAYLANRFGDGTAVAIPLLYGGSVSAKNIEEFVGRPNIDGALVGGASLDPDQFVEIVARTARQRVKVG